MSPARRSTSTAVFALFCREGGATLRPEVVCGYRQRRQLGGSGFLLQSFQLDAAIGHSMLQALRLQAALDLAGHQDFLEALGRRHGVHALDEAVHRSEERRVGKECVSTCRSRWSPCPEKKKKRTK